MRHLRPYVLSLLCGALGFVLLYGAVHLWHDHVLVHQLVDVEMQRQRQQMLRQAPAPPPAPPGPSGGR